MVEPNFSKYVKAPYLELDNYKAPKGIKSYFVCMDDGIKIGYYRAMKLHFLWTRQTFQKQRLQEYWQYDWYNYHDNRYPF